MNVSKILLSMMLFFMPVSTMAIEWEKASMDVIKSYGPVFIVPLAVLTGYAFCRESNTSKIVRATKQIQLVSQTCEHIDVTENSEAGLLQMLVDLDLDKFEATKALRLFDLLQELMDSINARYNSRFKPWNWTEGMKQSCQELSAAISCFEPYAYYIKSHEAFFKGLELAPRYEQVMKLYETKSDCDRWTEHFIADLQKMFANDWKYPLAEFVKKLDCDLDFIYSFINHTKNHTSYPKLYAQLADVLSHLAEIKTEVCKSFAFKKECMEKQEELEEMYEESERLRHTYHPVADPLETSLEDQKNK